MDFAIKFWLLILLACFECTVFSYLIDRSGLSSLGTSRFSPSFVNKNHHIRHEPLYSTLPQSYGDLRFSILGGGAFSLAIAKVLSYKNISTVMLVRNQTVADHINEFHFHPKYLVDSKLPKQLWATSDPKEALKDVSYVIHAVPMQKSRAFLQSIKEFIPVNVPILSVTKGVEQTTFCLMNDIIVQTLGEDCRAAYLSGPSFAKEIMDGEATAVVIASTDPTLASELAEILSCEDFRCHTSKDVKVHQQ